MENISMGICLELFINIYIYKPCLSRESRRILHVDGDDAGMEEKAIFKRIQLEGVRIP